MRFPCALGRGGLSRSKREGDGATPVSALALRRLWLRGDHGQRPPTGLPVRLIQADDGWCDAASHPRYNKPVRLPFRASHERMRRDDALYDLVIELGWNDRPVRRGRGSAIFMHVAKPGFSPTEGCVALNAKSLRRLAGRLGLETIVSIGLGPRKLRG
ncbi:L,D-transpeptidase [Hansschlegelia quercus]|nr:L,D-transpeptidase family protein [Hansschlegelia quercus]